ncbi:olfactory receptor 6C1-like [Tachyglossus aculeatus]|uniref:olfactory receptor 6C1-like n=1 Tax=Tachyglossus aculeatus TaxID=9261 RepID=UPI0018F2C223|nr:olfactory receptor 6C1-like [Tachyglossus aculeatus]
MALESQSAMRNHMQVTEFILLGITDDSDLQTAIFLYMPVTYVLRVTGNLTIITLTLLDSRLYMPMYFFLRCFSFLEICFTSTCIPRFLATIATRDRTISYICCVAQLFFFFLLGATEFFHLAARSYDRYVTICRPLEYTTILMDFILALGTLLVTLVLVAMPYMLIARAILRLPSTQQRKKAFYTCSSHMVMVSITYRRCIFMYIKPSTKDRVDLTKGT